MTPWAVLLLAALLVLPALVRSASRPWAAAFLACLALALGLLALPPLLPSILGLRWNWSGSLLVVGACAWVIGSLVNEAGMHWHEFGLTWRQRPGSLRPALVVMVGVLALHALTLTWPGLAPRSSDAERITTETWLYQALAPSVVEELLFRGLLLALLDRAFTGRRALPGLPGQPSVSLGWGAIVTCGVFVSLHAGSAPALLSATVAALAFLWLRSSTGSLVLPVLCHGAWNLIVLAAAASR